MEGGSLPVCPAAARLSSQRPEVVESTANPENVWKSSLSWHTSEDTCQQNIISYQGVLCRHLVEGEGAGGGAGGGVGAGVARVPDVGGVGGDGGAAGGGGDEACTQQQSPDVPRATSVATHSTLRSPPRSHIPSAEPPRVEHSELMMTVILGDTRGV